MSKPQEHKTPNGYSWYRLDNDTYGNPRIMTHFMCLVSPRQRSEARNMHPTDMIATIDALKQTAMESVDGKKYRGQWYGGFIVWQSYLSDPQINDMIDGIQADE